MHRRDRRCRRLKGLLWPEDRRGLIHIISSEVPEADSRPTQPAPRRGRRPLPTCLFLRRSASQPDGQDKSASRSRVWAGSARATLNQHLGGSREARAAGVRKSLQFLSPGGTG